ncbi:MAG TPA: alpha/beta hydrolase-fold protein, partial [Pirellulales bacterium]
MSILLRTVAVLLFLAAPTLAQPPEFTSPEVQADRSLVFRVFAPKAEAVKLQGGDVPGVPQGGAMTKGENGVWELKVGPVPAGAYRYRFEVDGVAVVDPRNPATSESNANAWSLASVPGSELCDLKDVPHGAVAKVEYFSKSLDKPRRMHVYTPPGYEKGSEVYPVLYLLHGASDSDASWSTIGRAALILDNLIAAGKAKPMLVVMPNGHTGSFTRGPGLSFVQQVEEFNKDFEQDVRPTVEARYRVSPERRHRAIAGLSMGGYQSLDLAVEHLKDFGYLGVFSSGAFGIAPLFGAEASTAWEDAHQEQLDDAEAKKDLRLLWVGCGKADFLLATSDATVEMLKRHQFNVTYRQTEGG